MILNGPIERVSRPSVTVIVMSSLSPTFVSCGVPVSMPVSASNVAHSGLLVMKNSRKSPSSGSTALGLERVHLADGHRGRGNAVHFGWLIRHGLRPAVVGCRSPRAAAARLTGPSTAPSSSRPPHAPSDAAINASRARCRKVFPKSVGIMARTLASRTTTTVRGPALNRAAVFRKKGSRRDADATLEAQGKVGAHAVVRDRQLVHHAIARARARKGPCEARDGGDSGNPAVIGALRIARGVPVDRRLCVPAFRRVCRYHFLLLPDLYFCGQKTPGPHGLDRTAAKVGEG